MIIDSSAWELRPIHLYLWEYRGHRLHLQRYSGKTLIFRGEKFVGIAPDFCAAIVIVNHIVKGDQT